MLLYNAKGTQVKGITKPLKGLIILPNQPVIPIVGEVVGWDMTLFGSEWVGPLTHRVVVTIEVSYDGKKSKTMQVFNIGTIERAIVAYNDALDKSNAGLPLEPAQSVSSKKSNDYDDHHPTTWGASYGSNGWRCDD